MNSDPAASGEGNSAVDQLEEVRKAYRILGLHNGRWPMATLVILALSVAVTGVAQLSPASLPLFLFSSGYGIWSGHQWFGLIGSIFIHAGVLHLACNCYWFWLFGRIMEVELGWMRYLSLVIGCAWMTGTVELALSGNPGVGLSGVLYAMFGYMIMNRGRIQAFSHVLPSKTIALLGVWLFACIGLTYLGVLAVANGAHFAGFGAGCAIGFVSREKASRLFPVTVVMVAVSSLPLFWAPWQESWLVSQATHCFKAGRQSDAMPYVERVLLKNPKNGWAYRVKGYIQVSNKQYRDAKATFANACNLSRDDAHVANSLAWLLCTCPDASVRDGESAVKEAKRACDLTNWESAACLDTYAAALAETNDFAGAVQWETKAAELAADKSPEYQEHLAAFKAGRAWRDPK